MINNFVFSGHLGRDAEVRHTPSGKSVTSFAVPCTSGYGQNQKTTWIECSLWGERGEKLAPYLTKGLSVVVCGEFSLSDLYEKKDGTAGLNARCNVSQIQLGKSQQPQQEAYQRQPKSSAVGPSTAKEYVDFEDDDVPF